MTMQAPRELPPELRPLAELALDLRWTWSHAGDRLWRALDANAWEQTGNPWFILNNVAQERLEQLSRTPTFVEHLQQLSDERRAYLDASGWFAGEGGALDGNLVAYFSMEFGIGQGIPLYAGGLGILAGDYLKAASDLQLPLVGVGILFQEGYFRQSIDNAGIQHEAYPYNDPAMLPITAVCAPDGGLLRLALELPGRTLWIRVWRANVGRVALYLLDTNDLLNDPFDRGITSKLYNADPETRLLQEMVLGIGGWRLVETLERPARIAHLNEGHAAFAIIERARQAMQRLGLGFAEALMATRAGNVFTTHTSVAAGFDRFAPQLIATHFGSSSSLMRDLGLSVNELLALGRKDGSDESEPFNMAYLAMRGCSRANGVSRLHGQVSRHIFADLFPHWPEHEVPIEHVTNGVHVPSWDSPAADELWTRACGKQRWLGAVEPLQEVVASLSDEQLWRFRLEQREQLIAYVRRRLARQLERRGGFGGATGVLDKDVLTVGFARRFATYKRPDLLLRDAERLTHLLNHVERPVQLVVAGKAHPSDEQGKRMLTEWVQFVSRPEVRHRAVFLEDYDIALAEELVRGVDVWLNTPRRPWEACGTSGMKVLVNGGLNLSELDGWWAEAYSPELGWALGDDSGEVSDAADAAQLYRLLETEIVPEFYERDERGVPRKWVKRVSASMARLAPAFSANRMLREYLERSYLPAADALHRRMADGALIAKELVSLQQALTTHWNELRFGPLEAVAKDGGWHFSVSLSLGRIALQSICVELYAEAIADAAGVCVPMSAIASPNESAEGATFACFVKSERPASHFTPRVVPFAARARVPGELNLIRWQR
jgi:starch phosphorylase